jgi:arsenate reductase
MSEKITIYQKPTCSKCRETLGILNEQGVEFESVNYYETPVTREELKSLIDKLGIEANDLLRKDEPIYRDLEIGTRQLSDDELIDLMIAHPDLMQRPIVVRGDRAVLARPPANVCDLF